MPIYGLAAGLGKLSVDSGLGEPLKAQIDLISVTPDELSSLSASIASEEAYAMQGITRLGVHSSIKVELAKNPDGSPVLKLRSQQPIDDPYLDMLIQVDWSSGRLLREYTILLDPPGYKQAVNDSPLSKSVFNPAYVPPEPNTANAPAASTSAEAYEVKPRLADKEKRKKKTADTTDTAAANESITQKETPVAVSEVDEVVTKRGDTLHSIAREVQPEGVSLDQMLLGLFNANKNAFVDGNMNRLKVGQIVRIPAKEDLTAVSQQQAAKEVKVHSANWNAYRNSLAGNVLAAEVAEDTDSKQSASGKIVSAEDQAAPIKSGPQDVVKLSAGGKVAAQGSKAGAESDAKILALQEEATAREKALKESQERTAALETQLADMQKLLALKSQTLAEAQKNAEAAIKTPETQQPAAAEPAVTSQAAPVAAPAAAEPVTAAAAESVATTPPDAAKNVTQAEATKKPPVVKAPVQPEPEEEVSFFATLLESVNLFMLAGAGGLTLLGAGWVYMRNKRRRDLDSFERGILTSGGLRANTVFGNTTGNATSSADTSFLTDFAQSADGGMIDTNDVDPIAEAEVYMAYGRDAQAEEILKDAISKEPARYELHLKLLEMYAARKDASAFETIAGELYTILGADDPIWAQVAQLGITVEPDNPLYDTSRIAPAASAASTGTRKVEAETAEIDISKDLDFSFDRPESSIAAEPALDMQSALSVEAQVNEFQSVQDQAQSVQVEENTLDAGSNPELSSIGTLDFAVAENTVAVDENVSVADNSMEFDFPDVGSFALNTEEPVDADKSTELTAASAQSFDSAPVFELPASSQTEEIEFPAPAEESTALSGLDFNFTAEPAETVSEAEVSETQVSETQVSTASSDFNFEGFANAVTPAEEEKNESSALNAMDFNFEGFGESAVQANDDNKQAVAAEGISLDFGSTETASTETGDNVEEISFEFPLADESEVPAFNDAGVPSGDQAGNFDFSAISLDLTDVGTPAAVPEAPQSAIDTPTPEPVIQSAVENENPDVDIKLDLVKVYIDMEDIEGARDLLDEVIKEGGPLQRQKAEALLSSLA